MSDNDLRTHPVHLGLGAAATPQPAFAGMPWYEAYAERTSGDGAEGRLVSLYEFSESWDSWEMHPAGDELVVCLSGEALTLQPYEYAVNGPGVWHTADIADAATALFITAGEGTRHRPRDATR
jgi:hypothetical protein